MISHGCLTGTTGSHLRTVRGDLATCSHDQGTFNRFSVVDCIDDTLHMQESPVASPSPSTAYLGPNYLLKRQERRGRVLAATSGTVVLNVL